MTVGTGVDRIVVVGGGIIGLAVARRLTQTMPGTEVVVVEKEDRIALHQTGRNSGVVHAGVYYPPGSLKARLCRRGIGLLRELCAEHGLAYEECGKVIVATGDGERGRLLELRDRAQQSGVPGVRLLDRAGLRAVEPHVEGVLALHSPTTAIVDFAAVARALAEEFQAAGGTVRSDFRVVDLRQTPSGVTIRSPDEELSCARLIICAGLHADRLARLAGDSVNPMIVPFRGEYHALAPHRRHLVRGLVYPVPDPGLPFLGIHFTKAVDGNVHVGPNAVLALSREGYRWRSVNAADLKEMLSWPGFRALVRRRWRTGAGELASSLSKRQFARLARRYVPALETSDLVRAPAGVRAQAVDRAGNLVDDFRISVMGRVTAIRNAPSPAATSSLAIAEVVCERSLCNAEH